MNDDTAVIEPVREDDFARELAQAAPRRWWNKGTIVLGGFLLLVGGFAGGLQAQKQWGTSDTPAAGARAFGGGQNRAGYGAAGGVPNFNGGQAQSTAAAAATTGKVKLVNGSTIYVETSDGSVVTVKTDGRTTVSTAGKGKVADVKAGQSVTIQGSTGTDGTVTATTVTAQK
ncbi:hypothetical protein KOI35_38025 [Actinoplanes bogorensis]|uniref:DUF5666 domain-containing protein n=1 Tax=Paractinoplanes bogorensis TaxID=1610840 RepID=A0ABS5Z0V6_9ACTN|nr:hypothetical protein [Actinoplanes bogorensis]MBU2669326.1 hypothetical protein [Actinoplanes bogorensis]